MKHTGQSGAIVKRCFTYAAEFARIFPGPTPIGATSSNQKNTEKLIGGGKDGIADV